MSRVLLAFAVVWTLLTGVLVLQVAHLRRAVEELPQATVRAMVGSPQKRTEDIHLQSTEERRKELNARVQEAVDDIKASLRR